MSEAHNQKESFVVVVVVLMDFLRFLIKVLIST